MRKQKADPSVNLVPGDKDDLLPPIYPKSQTNFFTLFIQAIPLLFGYPLRRVTSWFTFLHFLAFFNDFLLDYPDIGLQRLVSLLAALGCTKLTTWIVLPLIFICIKWCGSF
jgi:hypothetical protein